MDENRDRPSYVALVAALREEFTPGGLAAMTLLLRRYRYGVVYGSLGTLTEAVFDAYDVGFDAEPGTPCGQAEPHERHDWMTAPLDEGGKLAHCRGVKP